MLIQYKLQPLPNDGSRSNWRSRYGSFERNFAKENDKGGGKPVSPNFGTLTHVVGMRNRGLHQPGSNVNLDLKSTFEMICIFLRFFWDAKFELICFSKGVFFFAKLVYSYQQQSKSSKLFHEVTHFLVPFSPPTNFLPSERDSSSSFSCWHYTILQEIFIQKICINHHAPKLRLSFSFVCWIFSLLPTLIVETPLISRKLRRSFRW